MANLATIDMRGSPDFQELGIYVAPAYLYASPRIGSEMYQKAFGKWTKHNWLAHKQKAKDQEKREKLFTGLKTKISSGLLPADPATQAAEFQSYSLANRF